VSALSLAALCILAALVALVVCLAAFLRLADGRYAEALIARAVRIRPLRKRAVRSYVKDLAMTDPIAARAVEKIERVCGASRPSEAALSVLTDSERRAYLELFDNRAAPRNRAERRHLQGLAQRPYRHLIR
jgi:hypothetical protein